VDAACSPFETLEICFQLLSTGPGSLAIDGCRLRHGLPDRPIGLGELQILLHEPVASDLQRAVVDELVRLAVDEGGQWIVALAGFLLPGLRPIAAVEALRNRRPVAEVEALTLELLRDAIAQQGSVATQSVEEVAPDLDSVTAVASATEW
jgi:hypothetical protein